MAEMGWDRVRGIQGENQPKDTHYIKRIDY